MSDISNIVNPLSYSVKNAMEKLNINNIIAEKEGWKSSLDNVENIISIQIRLDEKRSFNRLSFELLDVPQKFSVYYWNENRNSFFKIQSFTGSVDGNIDGTKIGIETQNVWKTLQFEFPFVESDLIEIRINRVNKALLSLNLPQNTRYSVGIRNVNIRFHRVNSELVALNENNENKVNYFAPASVLSNSSFYWKSPALGPNSLYPFYVDLRKENGKAQPVEFMKLVPLYTGSHVNLYTSDDDSFSSFSVSTNKQFLSFIYQDDSETEGSTINTVKDNWKENDGVLIKSNNYWQVLNKDIKLNLNSAFTIGLTYKIIDFNIDIHYLWSIISEENTLNCFLLPSESISDSSILNITNGSCKDYKATFEVINHNFSIDDYIVISESKVTDYNGTWKISSVDDNFITVDINTIGLPSITSGKVKLANKMIAQLAVQFNDADPIMSEDAYVELVEGLSYGIVVGYDPENFNWTLTVCLMDTNDVIKTSITQEFIGFYPLSFNLNALYTNSAAGYIKNVWVRQDSYQNNYVNSFLRNTDTFIKGLGNTEQRNNGFYNTLLIAELTEDVMARVGPDASYYENKVWTPANKNFILNSSIYKLGRISSKFLKLEFAKPTAQYYNPATHEEVKLPILDFPDWVKEWYLIYRFDETINSTYNNYIFEAKNRLSNNSNSFGMNSIKSAIENSANNLIYNIDQIGSDFLFAPTTDEESVRNQIERNVTTLQFPTASRHNYRYFEYSMPTKRAFFYGIVELSFFNLDQSIEKDNTIYYGDFLDGTIDSVSWIEDYTNFFVTEDKMAMAELEGDSITSRDFISFSNFSSLQIGFLDSPLKDLMTPEKINFVDTSHLSTIHLSLTNTNEVVSATDATDVKVVRNLLGSTDGQTVILEKVGEGYYGLKTETITLPVSQDGVKLVAGCRVRSSVKTPLANCELRLLSNGKIVAKRKLDLPQNYGWAEFDLTYITNPLDTDFQLEIMVLDAFSDEALYVDMLGLWMARNKWEVSNDYGQTWVPVVTNMNHPFGIVSFPSAGNGLKLKITALEPSAWISQWIILPIYDFAPVGMNSPRVFDPSDADDPEFRSILNQKFFSAHSTSIPGNYSIITDVVGSKNRLGI